VSTIDDLAALQTPPPRGSDPARQWVAARLGWPALGVELERVIVDGHEPGSSVTLHTSSRRIVLTVAEMFSRSRFQAALGAALHYGAPLLKQDALNDVAGAILGLATVDVAYSSEVEANAWGTAYVLGVQRTPYDDLPDASRTGRFEVVQALRVEAAENAQLGAPPPRKALVRQSDGAMLVVRSWFHRALWNDLAPGDRALSPQRVATLMRAEGWTKLAPSHSKLAVREPGTRRTASLSVYVVPAGYGEEATDEPS
jgi:hypothetical protein